MKNKENYSTLISRLESSLEYLSNQTPSFDETQQAQQPPIKFDLCSKPDSIAPQTVVSLRKPISMTPLNVKTGDDVNSLSTVSLTCIGIKALEIDLGLDLRFNQTWNLIKFGLGDLSSTMSLAPSEELTLEFLHTQRKLLEKSTVNSTEEISSNESTTIDKEILNVTRSSAKTRNWNVNGNGSFTTGVPSKWGASLGLSGSLQQSITNTSNFSLQDISESTKKSSHSLKTLHKIEVRGVNEVFTQNRMIRKVKNPYRDRTLSLNVFQLLKKFSIETRLTEIRFALLININGLVFNNDFIRSYPDFLEEKLTDQSLILGLPLAIEGTKGLRDSAQKKATEIAKLALHYLYVEPNIFNVPKIMVDLPGTLLDDGDDPNNPKTSFDGVLTGINDRLYNLSGYKDALNHNAGQLFTILNFFYKLYNDIKITDKFDQVAISIATTLADDLETKWNSVTAEDIKILIDNTHFTEIFRRLSGFLTMVKFMLKPLVTEADSEKNVAKKFEEAKYMLDRLITHLQCNKHYYTQQFLTYIAQKTDNQAIIDFVNDLIDQLIVSPQFKIYLRNNLDIQSAFIDRQQIIVPGLRSLEDHEITKISEDLSGQQEDQFDFNDIKPNVIEIDVPCDGIHLEAVEGTCILQNIPAPQGKSFELTIHDANFKISED